MPGSCPYFQRVYTFGGKNSIYYLEEMYNNDGSDLRQSHGFVDFLTLGSPLSFLLHREHLWHLKASENFCSRELPRGPQATQGKHTHWWGFPLHVLRVQIVVLLFCVSTKPLVKALKYFEVKRDEWMLWGEWEELLGYVKRKDWLWGPANPWVPCRRQSEEWCNSEVFGLSDASLIL